ncbi:MAG: hypothetical protein ACREJ2_05590 [Planctomycetota bacterium]
MLLAAACLRALRRRRAVVPGLAVFRRAHARNLPPPPRWLDRVFLLKSLLLALLVAVIAGLAWPRSVTHPRRIAVLLDDGWDGLHRTLDGKPLSEILQARADGLRRKLASSGESEVEIVSASGARAPWSGPVDLNRVLEQMRLADPRQLSAQPPGVASRSEAWDEIDVVTARAPAADAPRSAGTRIVWHSPAAALAPNLGIVRVWIEPTAPGTLANSADAPPAPPVTPAAPSASAGRAGTVALWVELGVGGAAWPSNRPAPLAALAVETSEDGRQFRLVDPPVSVAAAIAKAGGVMGPLELPTGAAVAPWLRVRLVVAPAASGAPPASGDAGGSGQFPAAWSDGLALDDQVLLEHAGAGAVVAEVAPRAVRPMITAALQALNIPERAFGAPAAKAASETGATTGVSGAPERAGAAVLFVCDAGPEALARLAELQAEGPVLPVYMNPQFDPPGLHLFDEPLRAATTTNVPTGSPEFAVLGRQSWQIAGLRRGLLLYGGSVAVDSPAGPAIVRLLDGAGRPGWALLFDPAQSSLANRHAAAWLALWDLLRADAAALATRPEDGHAGWCWHSEMGSAAAALAQNALAPALTQRDASWGRDEVLATGSAPSEAVLGASSVDPGAGAAIPLAAPAAVAALLGVLLLMAMLARRRSPDPAG